MPTKVKAKAPTKKEIEKAKKTFTGYTNEELRQRGTEEPIALVNFEPADKELLPESGMRMRELTEQSHNNWLLFKTKQSARKVRENEAFLENMGKL
jgi:hypothetical protein